MVAKVLPGGYGWLGGQKSTSLSLYDIRLLIWFLQSIVFFTCFIIHQIKIVKILRKSTLHDLGCYLCLKQCRTQFDT